MQVERIEVRPAAVRGEAVHGDVGLARAVIRRFFAIDGMDHAGLLAIEFFTTMIPLIIIGFSWLRGFASNVNLGNVFIRQMHLEGAQAEQVRQAFGSPSDVHAVWTVAGIAGFLVWGIPMSMTVARMFALAWRRPQPRWTSRLWRGAVWFVVYLLVAVVTQRMSMIGSSSWHRGWLPFAAAVIPSGMFWGASAVLLLPGVDHRRRTLVRTGLIGAGIDLVVRLSGRVVLPRLLAGWTGFGSIGVAMTLMTWCGVLGTSWVVAACASAVARAPS